MLGTEWVYVAIGLLLSAHLVTLLYAYRSNGSSTGAGFEADAVDAGLEGDGESTVCQCPECGAENDSTYRFCRECVAELPAGQLHIEHPGGRQQPY